MSWPCYSTSRPAVLRLISAQTTLYNLFMKGSMYNMSRQEPTSLSKSIEAVNDVRGKISKPIDVIHEWNHISILNFSWTKLQLFLSW